MSDMPHYCTGCGQVHGGQTATDPSVEIARINAERDVQVAKLQARQQRDYNETAVAVAEVEGDAQVGSAEAMAEVIAAETPEPEPVIVTVEAEEEEPEIEELVGDEPPENDGTPVNPVPEKKKRSGWWG